MSVDSETALVAVIATEWRNSGAYQAHGDLLEDVLGGYVFATRLARKLAREEAMCVHDEHEADVPAFTTIPEGAGCTRCAAVVVSHEGGYGPDGREGRVYWSNSPELSQ